MGLSTFDIFKKVESDGLVEVSGERLKALQDVLLHILRDIDDVCSRHGIPYTLGGGSCLGAIRHKGFIPWDDDLDVNMTREGYRRFTAAYEEELTERYWLHDCDRTPGYDLAFPRLRLKGTTVRNRDDLGNPECGAYVDIFIIENAPSNGALRFFHGVGSMALGFAYSCRRFAAHAEENLSLVEGDERATSIFKKKIFIGKALSFRSVESWTKMWDRWNSLSHDERSDYVTIPVGRKHYFGETQLRDNYFPISRGCFNGSSVPLPSNPDSYMTSLYGVGYMTPPSEGERETHVVYEFDLGSFSKTVNKAEVKRG